MNQLHKGIGFALITMVISGVAVFANGLLVKGIDPVVHTTVKNSVSAVLLLIVLMMRGYGVQMRQLRGIDSLKLLAVGVIGGSVPFVLFFSGLKMIGPVEAAMIHKTLVIWVAILAIPFLSERLSLKMTMGIVFLYMSNYVVGFEGFGSFSAGHLMVLGATLLWAVENVLAKRLLADIPAEVVGGARMGVGSLLLILFLILSGKGVLVQDLSSSQWLSLIALGVLLFGYVATWYRALQLAPATMVSSILVGATVITTLLSNIFVTGSVDVMWVGQVVFVLMGMWLVLMATIDEWKARTVSRTSLNQLG